MRSPNSRRVITIGTKPRPALALLLYTDQRRRDVVGWAWSCERCDEGFVH
jgi:hypothetical protein